MAEFTTADITATTIVPDAEGEVVVGTGETGTLLHAELNDTDTNGHPASVITGLADVATTGDYGDLINTPGAGAVDSVNGQTGAVVLDAADVGAVDVTAVSAFALTVLDDTTAAAARATLGIGSLHMLTSAVSVLSLGPATLNVGFTDVDLTASGAPSDATTALLNVMIRDSGGGPTRYKIRKNGDTTGGPYGDGTVWGTDENISTYQSYHVFAPLDSGQVFEYSIIGGSASCEFYVQLLGYVSP